MRSLALIFLGAGALSAQESPVTTLVVPLGVPCEPGQPSPLGPSFPMICPPIADQGALVFVKTTDAATKGFRVKVRYTTADGEQKEAERAVNRKQDSESTDLVFKIGRLKTAALPGNAVDGVDVEQLAEPPEKWRSDWTEFRAALDQCVRDSADCLARPNEVFFGAVSWAGKFDAITARSPQCPLLPIPSQGDCIRVQMAAVDAVGADGYSLSAAITAFAPDEAELARWRALQQGAEVKFAGARLTIALGADNRSYVIALADARLVD